MSILPLFSLLSFAGESEPAYQVGTNSDTSGGHGCTQDYCASANNAQYNQCIARWQQANTVYELYGGGCFSPTWVPGYCTTDFAGCRIQGEDGICYYECHDGFWYGGLDLVEDWDWVKAHIPHM